MIRVEEGVTLIRILTARHRAMGCETHATPTASAGPARSAFLWADIFNGQDARRPTGKMAVRPRLPGLDSSDRESFSTANSDLIMAAHRQFRRSVRRDVEAGTSRQSGATTTPTNHPEK